MSIRTSVEDAMEPDVLRGDLDDEEVAEQLERVYEHVLHGRRPEAVGATERLADQLGVRLERPDGFPSRTSR